jgi:hypothetical protein
MKRLFLIFFLLILISSFNLLVYAEEAKVTAKVVDETGVPVENANVRILFYTWEKWGGWRSESKYIDGLSDKNGEFSATGITDGKIGIGANKESFYSAGDGIKFKDKKSGKWQPWNPVVELILKTKNAVPMYARKLGFSDYVEIPEVGKPIGFDLIESDWVVPYGKGKVADFIFKIERNFKSKQEFDNTLSLSFSNEGDGIQSVYGIANYNILTLPRQAPEYGYESILTLREYTFPHAPLKDFRRQDQNYFFRIRTVKKDGKIISAMYGKIHRNIDFDCINSKKFALILFTYYLNPDGTRNMEFDQNQNLLLNIPSSERPGGP